GFAIVSGLARGIDAAAHRASLSTGTVAVLAGGQDRIYPPEHADLLESILAEGAALTKMPLGREPRAKDFPRRNRLISGISLRVLGPTPVALDDLVRLTNTSPAVVRTVLLELELAGRVERHGNGLVSAANA